MARLKGVYPRTFEYVDCDGDMAHIELQIAFHFYPGCEAQIYGDPSNCYPAEPASWEVIGAKRQMKGGEWVAIGDKDWLFEWCRSALDEAEHCDIWDCLPDHCDA